MFPRASLCAGHGSVSLIEPQSVQHEPAVRLCFHKVCISNGDSQALFRAFSGLYAAPHSLGYSFSTRKRRTVRPRLSGQKGNSRKGAQKRASPALSSMAWRRGSVWLRLRRAVPWRLCVEKKSWLNVFGESPDTAGGTPTGAKEYCICWRQDAALIPQCGTGKRAATPWRQPSWLPVNAASSRVFPRQIQCPTTPDARATFIFSLGDTSRPDYNFSHESPPSKPTQHGGHMYHRRLKLRL
jgi:hypothetical protein